MYIGWMNPVYEPHVFDVLKQKTSNDLTVKKFKVKITKGLNDEIIIRFVGNFKYFR